MGPAIHEPPRPIARERRVEPSESPRSFHDDCERRPLPDHNLDTGPIPFARFLQKHNREDRADLSTTRPPRPHTTGPSRTPWPIGQSHAGSGSRLAAKYGYSTKPAARLDTQA